MGNIVSMAPSSVSSVHVDRRQLVVPFAHPRHRAVIFTEHRKSIPVEEPTAVRGYAPLTVELLSGYFFIREEIEIGLREPLLT